MELSGVNGLALIRRPRLNLSLVSPDPDFRVSSTLPPEFSTSRKQIQESCSK